MHKAPHLVGIAWRNNRHVWKSAHDCNVFKCEVSRAEWCIDATTSVGDESHRQIVKTKVNCYLLVAASCKECRNGIDVGEKALHREARSHSDDVLLAHTLHKPSVWKFFTHLGEHSGAKVRANEDDSVINSGEFMHAVESGLTHGNRSFQAVVHRLNI
jgi:hypothetical protein